MENPLLHPFDTPHQSIPFSTIRPEHFIPALKENIKNALAAIDEVVHQDAPPTFENTVEAMQNVGELLERNSSILFNLNSAETSDAIQEVTQQASPLLTQFQNDVRLNQALFERIKTIYENQEKENLSVEQQTLLEKEFKGFARNGALLAEDEKHILREIDTEKAQLGLTFGENVLSDTQAFELHITEEKELKGLPDQVKEMAAETAQSKNKEGWIFTLDYPSYVPLMTYAENRSLREKMSLAFGQRGFQTNDNNNTAIILRLIELRKKRAQLLGYDSHAAFVLEERMATSEENVKNFLEDLYQKAYPAAKGEWKAMEDLPQSNWNCHPWKNGIPPMFRKNSNKPNWNSTNSNSNPIFLWKKSKQEYLKSRGNYTACVLKKTTNWKDIIPRWRSMKYSTAKGIFMPYSIPTFFPDPESEMAHG